MFESKTFYANGNLHSVTFRNLRSEIHRDDGPAWIEYFENGLIKREKYYVNGVLSRDGGLPAWLDYSYKGHLIEKICYLNGKITDGLSKVSYYEDGSVSSEFNYENGELSSTVGPAVIHYSADGNVSSSYWYLDGKLHREDGPAIVVYHSGTKITSEHHFFIDNYRSFDLNTGANIIKYDLNGNVTSLVKQNLRYAI